MINTRLAEPEDVEKIREIYAFRKVTYPFKGTILVAEEEGKIVGAIRLIQKDQLYKPFRGNTIISTIKKLTSIKFVNDFEVLPEKRLQGIGTKLVKELLKCSTHLKEDIYVGISKSNPFKEYSKKAFLKNGFKEVGNCFCGKTRIWRKYQCEGILMKWENL